MNNHLCDVKQHVKDETFILNASNQVQPKAEAMCMFCFSVYVIILFLFVCLSCNAFFVERKVVTLTM